MRLRPCDTLRRAASVAAHAKRKTVCRLHSPTVGTSGRGRIHRVNAHLEVRLGTTAVGVGKEELAAEPLHCQRRRCVASVVGWTRGSGSGCCRREGETCHLDAHEWGIESEHMGQRTVCHCSAACCGARVRASSSANLSSFQLPLHTPRQLTVSSARVRYAPTSSQHVHEDPPTQWRRTSGRFNRSGSGRFVLLDGGRARGQGTRMGNRTRCHRGRLNPVVTAKRGDGETACILLEGFLTYRSHEEIQAGSYVFHLNPL